MLRREIFGVYRRLLVLGLLITCLFVLGSDENTEVAYAAGCIQDCEAQEAMCYDSCPDECSADDTSCNSCIGDCHDDFRRCVRFAIWCSSGGTSYSPACQVGYADHCPVDPNTGVANCSDPSAHSGYYQICQGLGGSRCIACPDHEFCVGSNGLNPCF
jgi:hypothetical protein